MTTATRSRFKQFLWLGLSASALACLVAPHVRSARAEHIPMAASAPLKSASHAVHPIASNAAPTAQTKGSAWPQSPAARDATNAVESAETVASVAVPNLRGWRLSKARRELQKLGFRVVLKAPGGGGLSADELSYYRVVKQSLAPDSQVPKGTAITLFAGIPEPISGY